MTTLNRSQFNCDYDLLLQHLKIKGLRPKTVDAYSRAVKRLGRYFEFQIRDLSKQQLIDYFSDFLDSRSWSTVKLHLHGLKFYYRHVLERPWVNVDLLQPPKATRIVDIITVEEAQRLFMTTTKLSYRVFFFTVYSLGLRLGEGLGLQVGDIDPQRRRVIVRNAKGNKDRLVPLPDITLDVLRRFWSVHKNPSLLFPNRKGGLAGSAFATTALDRGGVQVTIRKAVADCGIKKRSPYTVCATATQPI